METKQTVTDYPKSVYFLDGQDTKFGTSASGGAGSLHGLPDWHGVIGSI